MIITISLVNSHHLTELQGFCSCDESENEVKVTVSQSCPTLCDPVGYTIHGILQARILEWVAIPFSRVEEVRALKKKKKIHHIGRSDDSYFVANQ